MFLLVFTDLTVAFVSFERRTLLQGFNLLPVVEGMSMCEGKIFENPKSVEILDKELQT